MKKEADSMDIGSMMFLALIVHAWIAGCAWHFWLEHMDFGAWFYIPLLLSSVATWVVLGAFFCWIGELLGFWDKPS